jgi:hypothetical protein
MSVNCDMSCMEAEARLTSERGRADRTMCRTQFDNYYSCQWDGPICDSESRCRSRLETYVACVVQYCMANPSSSDCSGM